MKKRFFKFVAKGMLLTLSYQLIFPACAYALTTGPSQPEVQSFEPVGTTEMVDMFTGDFNYNIPLMDVEGYPINIFYHSGVGIEQEASWVGLGWNINPGEINRTVRGLPDDFKGETIEKSLYIKQEENFRIGIGVKAATEIFGYEGFKLALGTEFYMSFNNYRGISSGVSKSIGIQTPMGSAGINIGVGSQTGADIDFDGSLSTPDHMSKLPFGASLNASTGFNSRSGMKDISLDLSVYARIAQNAGKGKEAKTVGYHKIGTSLSHTIPIGVQNYVPVITNRMIQKSFMCQVKFGTANQSTLVAGYIPATFSKVSYDKEREDRASYGYMYLENATDDDILDFNREKDGIYNETVKNLPPSTLAYDIYSINGHGTGGMFRAHRNDIGTIYDPKVNYQDRSNNLLVEGGIGSYGEGGTDFTWIITENQSGSWPGVGLGFRPKTNGSLFENVFFKQAGELTYNQQQEAPSLFNKTTQYLSEDLASLTGKGNSITGYLPPSYDDGGQRGRVFWDGFVIDRSSRANNISYQTAEQAMKIPEMDMSKQIISYNQGDKFYNPTLKKYNRYGVPTTTSDHPDKPHHISEFTQTTPDGRRYVYGIPAMNHTTREVTFSVNEKSPKHDLNKGLVAVDDNDRENNGEGVDNYYSSSITPSYAHSYLLTALLSADYVDILGDGPTDDDLGSYVKYNYSLKSNDYRWRTPYNKDTAQYSPGFWADDMDGKGNYIAGSRQQWYVRTIETKNYVAEFYTTPRLDAKGYNGSIGVENFNSLPAAGENVSYKLDAIRLYNKHDRYINKDAAVPIKTVIFNYSYDLCQGAPNAVTGKLTLEKIFIQYGNSQKNLLSPYVFSYRNKNNYNSTTKDRWGNYKKTTAGIFNHEFPYTNQPDALADEYEQNEDLSDWNLTEIKLPSGGKMQIKYESDDYSFVQDKRSMQMLRIVGVGSSKKFIPKNVLYNNPKDIDNINDYVYIKRRKGKENPSFSIKQNYLDGQDLLYYNFSLDIAGIGKFDPIKGYAIIEEADVCEGNDDYAYIKLKRDLAKNVHLHPATILGINTGRYYIPHKFYDGYQMPSDPVNKIKNIFGMLGELARTIGGENPFKHFVKKGKARQIEINKSWVRVTTPGLTKKGGGIRVNEITLSDNWKTLSGNEDANYGKQYDYTIKDEKHGKISSGVASYEPMIGADEIALRKPVPYSAESGRGLPSIDFFQEEPFGESFFPAAVVGYSSVKVSSIHQQYGRSAQAIDEHLFYTAKDYPIKVDYTEKNTNGTGKSRSLFEQVEDVKVRQGYCLTLNDMHGKPKAVNNYVVRKDLPNIKNELITGTRYYYNEDNQHELSNTVRSLVRKRGTQNTFEVKDAILGQDVDFTVDSRHRSSVSTTRSGNANVNVLNVMLAPVPIFTFFPKFKANTKNFNSLVSTKIIQQYGILKSIETIDHGAKTITENLVYDAETGSPLLTRTNNEFNDITANLSHPAYLAYEGMRPAYSNDGYEEVMDSLVVNYDRDGFLYTDNFERFTDGDELLVESRNGLRSKLFKLWVMGTGVNMLEPTAPEPIPDQGSVCFAKHKLNEDCNMTNSKVFVDVFTGSGSSKVIKATSTISKVFVGDESITCGSSGAFTTRLPEGVYKYEMYRGSIILKSGSFTITKDGCVKIILEGDCPGYGTLTLGKSWDDDPEIGKGCMPVPHVLYEIRRTSPLPVTSIKAGLITEDGYSTKMEKLRADAYYEVVASFMPLMYHLSVKVEKVTVGPFKVEKGKTYSIIYRNCVTTFPIASFSISSTPSTSYKMVGGTTPTRPPTSVAGTTPGGALFKTVPTGEGEAAVYKRCALKVSPRFKDKFSGTTNQSTWPLGGKSVVFRNVKVKVLRSGRRNNLNQTVQQTTFNVPKSVDFNSEHMATVDKLFTKTEGILSVGVKTYTDSAQIYTPFLNEMDIAGEFKYGKFNSFVLGCRGNFRPLASYAPLTNRHYEGHSRSDGDFQVTTSNQFWSIANGTEIPSIVCDGNTNLFREQSRTGPLFWKLASEITRYDVFGNAIEEKDAIGNYSAAQYGYNKSLPVSVASNAKYQQFMFDGFEDYNMLLPEKIAALFLKGDLYSAFAILYGNNKAGSNFTAYGQKYHLRELTPVGSSLVLSQEQNHTGYFSMKALSATSFTFNVGNAISNEIGAFKFAPNNKYLVQLWAKSSSGLPITDGMFKTYHGIYEDMKVKSGSIDGWYQVEALVDVTSGSTTFNLEIPANVFVDDIRILPNKSNMKSFVYDPISFKLVAQLDENHYATFFEYDQEGLLVRTKKETAKGVVTISESRRANYKKDNSPHKGSSSDGSSSTSSGSSY